jgi:hypothetical protein
MQILIGIYILVSTSWHHLFVIKIEIGLARFKLESTSWHHSFVIKIEIGLGGFFSCKF